MFGYRIIMIHPGSGGPSPSNLDRLRSAQPKYHNFIKHWWHKNLTRWPSFEFCRFQSQQE